MSKYHTIDPLILQTLNLNEKRMNHIFDILHGRPSKSKQQPQKVKPNKYLFQSSLRQDYKSPNSSSLPYISQRAQKNQKQKKDKKYLTLDSSKARKPKSLQKNIILENSTIKNQQQLLNIQKPSVKRIKRGSSQKKSPFNITQHQTTPVSLLDFSKISKTQNILENSINEETTNKRQKVKNSRNTLAAVRNKFSAHNKNSMSPLSGSQTSIYENNQTITALQGSLLPSSSIVHKPYNYRLKTKQLLNDYAGQYTLKKSKSMQVINPKDIYRLEIQNLVAELTPIQKLQQSQKKMKRIKKRHQNLKHFDQRYYSRLNEMDLIAL